MITAVEARNFKGIGANGVRFELKPITLLFGSNSAGKSSIFHALLLAHEVLRNQNYSPQRCRLAGDAVDLGGFRSFVHRQDVSRRVELNFDVDLSRLDPEDRRWMDPLAYDETSWRVVSPTAATVGLTIAWDTTSHAAYLQEYRVCIDDEPLGRLVATKADGIRELLDFNLYHPQFAFSEFDSSTILPESIGTVDEGLPGLRTIVENLHFGEKSKFQYHHLRAELERRNAFIVRNIDCPEDAEATYSVSAQHDSGGRPYDLVTRTSQSDGILLDHLRFRDDAGWTREEAAAFAERTISALAGMPRPSVLLPGANPLHIESALQVNAELVDLNDDDPEFDWDTENAQAIKKFEQILTHLFLVPGRLLASELDKICYIGPLRDVPPRNHVASYAKQPAGWVRGMRAWDVLHDAPQEFVDEVSSWLKEPNRLGTGFSLRRARYKEVPIDGPVADLLAGGKTAALPEARREFSELAVRTRLYFRDDMNGLEVAPADIAVGINQLLPVVVAALQEAQGLTLIEQPELHNHPAVELGLGDLFIRSVRRWDGGRFILETHGEHLLLRMLRRIRETTEGELPEGRRGLRPDDIAVYFVERSPEGVKATPLRVNDAGEFIDRWPHGFFDERIDELYG